MVRHAVETREDNIVHNNEISETVVAHGGKDDEFVSGNFYERTYTVFKTFLDMFGLTVHVTCSNIEKYTFTFVLLGSQNVGVVHIRLECDVLMY